MSLITGVFVLNDCPVIMNAFEAPSFSMTSFSFLEVPAAHRQYEADDAFVYPAP
jgi:hypothetical protein